MFLLIYLLIICMYVCVYVFYIDTMQMYLYTQSFQVFLMV